MHRVSPTDYTAKSSTPLETRDHSLQVVLLILLDGSSYLRQSLTISTGGHDVPISRVALIDLTLPGAHVSGSVAGSPIVAGDLFLGFEHPLSQSGCYRQLGDRLIERDLPSTRASRSLIRP